jgi:predicted RNase H-like HicB family nuclease
MGYFDSSPAPQADSSVPGKTRAQVVAELKDAQEHGLVDYNGFVGGQPFNADKSAAPGKTRAQVQAELKAAQQQGLAENHGFIDAPVTSQKSVTAP